MFTCMNILAQNRKENKAVSGLEIRRNKSINKLEIEKQEGFQEFQAYTKKLKNRLIVFADKENPSKGLVINQYYKSRYSKQGRLSVGRRIRQGANYHVEKGVFLTLTYAHTITADQAWAGLSDDIKRITSEIKVKYKRENGNVDLEYFWVVEAQQNGYPHIHIFYADIDWLLDKKDIRKLWKRGFIKVNKKRNINIGKYMAKYLTKQEFVDSERINVVMFFVWKYRIRLYGFSQRFRPVRAVMEKRYTLIGFCTLTYDGDANIPDLQTLLESADITEVEFWWGDGGGETLKVQKNEKMFFEVRKHHEEIPF